VGLEEQPPGLDYIVGWPHHRNISHVVTFETIVPTPTTYEAEPPVSSIAIKENSCLPLPSTTP
jgi:hypothetical protein